MKIAFLSDFTPVPKVDLKLHVDGRIANALIDLYDAEIDWLTTDFSHYQKKKREFNSWPDKNVNVSVFSGIPYKNNTSIFRIFHNIKYAINCYNYLKVRKYDYIVSPIPSIEASFAAMLVARIIRSKHIVLIYDKWPDILLAYSESIFTMLKRTVIYSLYNSMLLCCLKKSHKVYAVSKEYAKWANTKSPGINSEEIYIGFSDSDGGQCARGNNKHLHFVYLGSWGESSDITTIYEAAKKLIGCPVRFTLAGRTSSDLLLKSLPNLEVVGWLNEHDSHKLLSDADVGLMVYNKKALQSLPNKYYEYLSFGCYIINSLEGEASELINENGFGVNVKAGDVEALIRTIKFILRTDIPPKSRIRETALQEYGNNYFKSKVFTWTK